MTPVTGGVVSAAGTLQEVLDGRFGQRGVRQLVQDPLLHGLAALTDARVADGLSGGLELLRTKYKPSKKLSAYYRVVSRDSTDSTALHATHLAVSWFAGTRFAQPRVELLVSPADPLLPQVGRLSDPRHLAELVGRLTGRQLPDPAVASIGTIRYRPGQRHVLLAQLADGARVFVKADRDDSGATAVPVADVVSRALAQRCPEDRAVEPMGYAAADSAALWWHAPGTPLSLLLNRQIAQATSAVHRAGQVLRAIHDSPAVLGACAGVDRVAGHDASAEARSTLRAGEHIEALLPAVGRSYRALVYEALDGLERLPEDAATFTHGDYKCDNILVHEGRLRILDLDRAGWAEPALDLGKFLADLSWWCPRENELDRLCRAFRAGYGRCDAGRWARAGLVAGLLRLKLPARRCMVHDPRWKTQVRDRVADAGAALRLARSA